MWNRFQNVLRRIASTRVVWSLGLLSLFVLLMINVRGLPGAFHSDALRQAGLLDMTINYSPESAYAKLAAYGEPGRYGAATLAVIPKGESPVDGIVQ